LKFNRTDDFALNCFWHWVEIAKAMCADYWVVCDNAELCEKILAHNEYLQIIPSEREKLIDFWKGVPGRWVNVGYALLTPFVHAEKLGIENFWNIDADDTFFYCEIEQSIELLILVSLYAENHNIDCISYDMWYSQHSHWTFGIAYFRKNEYLSLLKEKNEILQYLVQVDKVFRKIKSEKWLKIEAFYCENLRFEHLNQYTQTHSDGFLYYEWINLRYPTIRNFDPIGVPIKYDLIKFDIGLSDKQITKISSFHKYMTLCFNLAPNVIIFIASADAHVPQNGINRKLDLLKALGIQTDLQKAFRHSWLCVIDGGEVKKEIASLDMLLSAKYYWEKHTAEIMSQGWNYSRTAHAACSVKIDGIEYAVNERGLNVVIWNKQADEVIDSVCFDTWDNVSFFRKSLQK
jgi:hypothetical protein